MLGAASKSTRTFSDFESVADAMNGICQLYEQRLKQMNPGMSTIADRPAPPHTTTLCVLLLSCVATPPRVRACSHGPRWRRFANAVLGYTSAISYLVFLAPGGLTLVGG